MGISQFPAPDTGGGGLTNDFILDKNDTTNNTFEPGRAFEAGGYSLVVTGSTAYDIYLISEVGSAVGYSNGTSIVADTAFDTIVALGLGTADVVSFTYNGPSTNAGTAGNETGAGPYLTSITPSDLPQLDDTAIVAGGNFAGNLELSFVSGTVTLPAKNVVVGSSTAAVVTRPDGLLEDFAPYDLVAVNPGVTSPSGSNANVLVGTVTAGQDPAFVTTSPILGASPGSAFSTAIQTSDAEGSVVAYALTAGEFPAGLSLATATGIISGTVAGTATGVFEFTLQITDDAGNTTSGNFEMPTDMYVSGPNSTVIAGTYYVWATATDDFVVEQGGGDFEYLMIAGGGGGGDTGTFTENAGGGGAGGLLFGTATSVSAGTITATIGGGGAVSANGTDTILATIGTAFAGGAGGDRLDNGSNGGSGGGAGYNRSPGLGTAGQGNNGGDTYTSEIAGGGGGAGGSNSQGGGGSGRDFGAYASAISIIYDAGYFAGGGGGGSRNSPQKSGGLGGGGLGAAAGDAATPGSASSGGGGGAAAYGNVGKRFGAAGGSGLIVVKF